MSDLILNVRQIGSYPAQSAALASDTLLIQRGGLGGPYYSTTPSGLLAGLSSGGQAGIGIPLPGDAMGSGLLASMLLMPLGCTFGWNWYRNTSGSDAYLGAGYALQQCFTATDWTVSAVPTGQAGQPIPSWQTIFDLNLNGTLTLPTGTLAVSRNAQNPMEAVPLQQLNAFIEAAVVNFTALTVGTGAPATVAPGGVVAMNGFGTPGNLWFNAYPGTQPGVTNYYLETGTAYRFVLNPSTTSALALYGYAPMSGGSPVSNPQNSWVFGLDGRFVTNQATILNNPLAGQDAVNLQYLQSTPALSLTSVALGYTTPPTPTQANGTLIAGPGQGAGISTTYPNGLLFNAYYDTGMTLRYLATAASPAYGILPTTSSLNVFTFAAGTGGSSITGAAQSTFSFGLNGIFTSPQVAVAGNATSALQVTPLQQVQALIAAAVTSFNGRTGAVLLQLADVTGVGGAPLASPAFSGTPTAPTANPGTNTGQIATTAFVMAEVQSSVTGVTSWNTRTGAVTLQATDINNAGGALLNSPAFSGTPTAPTAPSGTTSTQLATTAFVMNEVAAIGAGVTTFNTRSGNVVLSTADVTSAGGAPVASPALSGTPTAPTAAVGTSTTQIATTAFVAAALVTTVTSFNGRTGVVTLAANDVSAAGGALINSPIFTGIPQAPTAVPGTANTEIATTAFVMQAVGTISPTLVQATAPANPNIGQLWWNNSDGQLYVYQGSTWVVAVNPPLPTISGFAPLNSPAFTGVPTTPTPPAGDNSTTIADTAYVQTSIASIAHNIGRNLLHNGLFNVRQRGLGPWTTGGYTADRWIQTANGGDTISTVIFSISDAGRSQIGDEAAVDGLAPAVTGTNTATSETWFSQAIEGVHRLSGKTTIVSFYASAMAAGLRIGVSGAQRFGTGGSPSAVTWLNGQAVAISTAWQRYSVVLVWPSTAGKTLGTNGDDCTMLALWLSCAPGNPDYPLSGNLGVQSGTFNIWGVQLEVVPAGSTVAAVTPLEKLDPRIDLSNCQRFYVVTPGISNASYNVGAGANVFNHMTFPVTMRASPTINYNITGQSNVSTYGTVNLGVTGCDFYVTAAAAGGFSATFSSANFSADL